jgi:hypothetical protein
LREDVLGVPGAEPAAAAAAVLPESVLAVLVVDLLLLRVAQYLVRLAPGFELLLRVVLVLLVLVLRGWWWRW